MKMRTKTLTAIAAVFGMLLPVGCSGTEATTPDAVRDELGCSTWLEDTAKPRWGLESVYMCRYDGDDTAVDFYWTRVGFFADETAKDEWMEFIERFDEVEVVNEGPNWLETHVKP